ncbi:unnamed protein product [Urochloa decumbens]|uniref:Glycosyltransferase n=1 Tax=Urochloa decumbens TaxID=240449 RepID=A0ABC9AEM4_9POAL
MSMSSSPPPAHVLLVSAPLQGHVNPLLVLGRRLASRGLLVTFSTVPHAGLKFTHGDGAAVAVGRGTLRFEHLQGGTLWPPNDPRYCAPTAGGEMLLRHLEDAAPAALAGLLRRHSDAGRPVSCVVSAAFAPWAGRAAAAAGVPHAVLWTESCAVLSLFYHYFYSLADFPSNNPNKAAPVDAAAVPGLPPVAAADLPALIHAPENLIWRQVLVADLRGLRDTASWVLVNTFHELERPAIDALRAHLPVTPVGPLFEPDNHGGGVHDDGDGCTAWLDAWSPGSVVFVAFGSLIKPSRDETAELAAGLAATGRPFLLVVRGDSNNQPELLPDDGGRCKVVEWCEQGRVLSHAAVGCFVTHCGWNSTTEALASGVPVVTFPAWADQPTNAKFLVDVYGVGVRLPRPMARDAVSRCVEEVMSGPEAAAMRARAGEWKAAASAAVADGGSSDRGVQGFVDAVLSLKGAGDD